MNTEQNEETEDYKWLKAARAHIIKHPHLVFVVVGWIVAICCLISFLPPVLEYVQSDDPRMELKRLSPPLLGDSFGLLNAIMATIAVIGLLFTLALQSKEIDDAQEALKLTMEGQEKAAQQNTLATYMNVVSTALSHYHTMAENGPDVGHGSYYGGNVSKKDAERRVNELGGRLESLMVLLEGDVKKSVSLAGLAPFVSEADWRVGVVVKNFRNREQFEIRDMIRECQALVQNVAELMVWGDESREGITDFNRATAELQRALDDASRAHMELDFHGEGRKPQNVLPGTPEYDAQVEHHAKGKKQAEQKAADAERRLTEAYEWFRHDRPKELGPAPRKP